MAEKNSSMVPESGKKLAQKKEKKPNIFVRAGKRIARWFREMKSELKKVVWPSRKQIINNTLIVIAFVAIAAIVVGGVDILLTTLVDLVLKRL